MIDRTIEKVARAICRAARQPEDIGWRIYVPHAEAAVAALATELADAAQMRRELRLVGELMGSLPSLIPPRAELARTMRDAFQKLMDDPEAPPIEEIHIQLDPEVPYV